MTATNKTLKKTQNSKSVKKRPCPLTIDQINVLDHKAVDALKRFISDRGKILPRRNTGVCAKKQRIVANAIKRARNLRYYCHIVQKGVKMKVILIKDLKRKGTFWR